MVYEFQEENDPEISEEIGSEESFVEVAEPTREVNALKADGAAVAVLRSRSSHQQRGELKAPIDEVC